MKCFYHNDMDGRCAGAIVARYENNYNRDDFYEVDYIKPLPIGKVDNGEKVYLVDYSFKKDTVWQLEKLINEKKCDVIWIDHHTSSLNLQKEEEFSWTNDIKGIRQDKLSGAALTFTYLYDSDTPYAVKLVSDYDCWVYEYDPDTTYFKLGLETVPHDAIDEIWTSLIFTKEENLLDLEYTVDKLANEGAIIKNYIDRDNEAYRDNYAYETMIGGIKCLAVNRKTNSWIFGEKYNEYPVVMVYAFNGDKWSYSIFSSDKSIDCSKIAESYGGGGHRGAAGFTLDDMPFKKCE